MTMNARLVRFSLGNGHRDIAQTLADDIIPRIAAQPGCQRATVFGDDADGQYGIFVLWCCEAHANEAAQVIQPILNQHLAGNVQAPPDRRLFEVLSDSA
jgi:quinol monooxygenase YgiN